MVYGHLVTIRRNIIKRMEWEECSGPREVVHIDPTGYPWRIWPAKVSIL